MRDFYNPYRFPELLDGSLPVFGPTAEIFGTTLTPRARYQGPPRPGVFQARASFDGLESEADQLIRQAVMGFLLVFVLLAVWVQHGSESAMAKPPAVQEQVGE